MKRVLVTGATGFIGRQSILPLLDGGFEIHALHTKNPIESDPRVIWHKADLLENGSASKICDSIKPSHLLHFAWYVNPKDYKSSPENQRWMHATLALLGAFKKSGGTRAVLAGSCMEYDWTSLQDALIENSSPIAPATEYGKAKNETRLLAENYARENSLSIAWGRIFNLFGPYEAPERLIPMIINSLSEGNVPRITAGGLVRDYSYVADTAGSFVALLDTEVTGIVNIASGKPVTLKGIAVVAAEIIGQTRLVESIPETVPENEPARVVADVKRLTTEVGWQSRHAIREGLEATIEWWRNNRS